LVGVVKLIVVAASFFHAKWPTIGSNADSLEPP